MKSLFSLAATLLILFISTGLNPAHAGGLSFTSKGILIKRTNPEFRDFVRQYLEFSDAYSSGECLEYGKKTRWAEGALLYCTMYFDENYGLSITSATFIRAAAEKMNYSFELKGTLYKYLTQSRNYSVEGCNQAWQVYVNGRRKEHQLHKIRAYKESNPMCETFFRP